MSRGGEGGQVSKGWQPGMTKCELLGVWGREKWGVAVNNARQPTPSEKETFRACDTQSFAWVSQNELRGNSSKVAHCLSGY